MISDRELEELDCFIAREYPQKEPDKGLPAAVGSFFSELFSDALSAPETLGELSPGDIDELDDYIKGRFSGCMPEFNVRLAQYMSERNLSRTEVCRRALIDRRFIAKILDNKGYIPRMRTVMALSLALHLSVSEYDEFMSLAGYSADMPGMTAAVVKFCIIKGNFDEIYYDIEDKVNPFLAEKKQPKFAYNSRKEPDIDFPKCSGCGKCAELYPDIYEMKAGKAYVKMDFSAKTADLSKSAISCPQKAISII